MTSTITYANAQELKNGIQNHDCFETGDNTPFATYDWILSASETLVSERAQRLVLVKEFGKPVSLAALEELDGTPGVFGIIGVESHGEPGDFQFDSIDHLCFLTDELAAQKIPLNLTRVPETSPLVQAIKDSYKHCGFVITRPLVGCPYITIKDTEEETRQTIPKRMLQDLNRAKNKANALGETSLEIHSPSTQEELSPLWQCALDIEAASWKGREGTALQSEIRIRRFYENYAYRACKKGILRICFFSLDGVPIAMQIAVEQNQRFWLLKIGYNEKYAKCSPGMLLMMETLLYSARKKLKSYEFLGSSKEWTRRWTRTERNNVSISVYPMSLQGLTLIVNRVVLKLMSELRQLVRKK